MKKLFFLFLLLFLASGCKNEDSGVKIVEKSQKNEIQTNLKKPASYFDFATLSEIYKFRGKVAEKFKVEYIKENQSINIFDPEKSGANTLDKSQIFIRHFKAKTFLTLNTVNILKKESLNINGHRAVKYEIEKKSGVPNFPNQPVWRNFRHKLIDIALDPSGETYFYVFSHSSEYPEEDFENFIQSLVFFGDTVDEASQTFSLPIENALTRITKKPFGIKIDPSNSPVSPEKFSGFHTGTDFEILEGEESKEINIYTICKGKILQKSFVSGYGGLVVQSCEFKNSQITVNYGHLDIESVKIKVGEDVGKGEFLGVLGEGFTKETDGERKHLHLALHLGQNINVKGYVKTQDELKEWIDFAEVYR